MSSTPPSSFTLDKADEAKFLEVWQEDRLCEAAADAAAMTQPTIRFVPVKTVDPQAAQVYSE